MAESLITSVTMENTLSDWALLRVHGADAAQFLQGQLTQDIAGLPDRQWRFAGYCNPKGRLLTTMLAWRSGPEQIFLALPAGNAEPVAKRLAMFVMRAKAKVAPAEPPMTALGFIGDAAVAVVAGCGPLPEPAGHFIEFGGGFALDCSTVDDKSDGSNAERRIMLWLPADHAAMATLLPAACSNEAWRAADIAAGIAHVDAATREAFVPQTINFELIGGVNFKKGCYPGQEIVARSQYLGKLKRRLAVGRVDGVAAVAPLMDVFAREATEPAGSVAAAAPGGDGWLVAFEATLAAQQAGGLRLGDGRAIALQPLPYDIVDVTA
jgi:tRNA-modifying protein YgfZ